MPIIRPSGLLAGERIAQLSDTAKLYWPFLYAASNGYGRFELDYLKILESAFPHFQHKPSEESVRELIREYRDKHLLFIYKSNGRLWCAWDDAANQQYFNAKDKASPSPPEPAFSEWRDEYRTEKQSRERQLTDLEKAFDPDARLCTESVSSEIDDFDIENPTFQNELDIESITNLHNTSTSTQLITQSQYSQELSNTTRARVDKEPVSIMQAIGWKETVEAAIRAGMAIDPSTDSPFFKEVWVPSPMNDKADCVRGIYTAIDDGVFGPTVDPKYVPPFRNYWTGRRWNEVRPRNRGQPQGTQRGVGMMRDLTG